MVNLINARNLLAGLVSAALLMTALPAFAQEATAQAGQTAAATQAPPGGGLLFLLIGLGAIVLISAIWLVRERTEAPSEA